MSDDSNASLEEPPFRKFLTDRLVLRTLRVNDAERMMPILTDDEVMKWTTQRAVTNVSQAETWLSARTLGRGCLNFAVHLRHDDIEGGDDPAIIGVVGSFHLGKVGYLIRPDQAGKGVATEALQALLPEIFKHLRPVDAGGLGFDHIEGWIDAKNAASRRILQKCGFMLCNSFPEPESVWGPIDVEVWRKTRPGKTLEDLRPLGLGQSDQESAGPLPPVQ